MNDQQKETLRSNHLKIVNTIDLTKSLVLDHLIEDGILSEGEQEEILSQSTPREQNTKLLFIVKRRSRSSHEPFASLTKALETDYDFLAARLSEAVSSRATEQFSSDIILKLPLYKCLYCKLLDNLIPNDITHYLFQEGLISDDDLDYLNNSKEPRQSRVCTLLKLIEPTETEITKSVFISALKKKYNFIVEHLRGHEREKITCCSCQKIEEEKLPVLKCVSRTFPNDKRLMQKCSKLWNVLFGLREKGEWGSFRQVTDKAFKNFSDPDLLVMLYRSEMCISTFYMNDYSKACQMFEKAIEILPSTRMSNWHLARILPLKIDLLAKTSKLDEASSILQDAHQTMETLEPCLSTGAVYFFEGMFLGVILRKNPMGTKSKALSKRVKHCFLTAIDHYGKERFFGVKSFLNQVYLFLALFCLGVDFQKIQYMCFQVVSKDDIDIATHYLDMFERECWDMSTNWSQMLFYIARAEEHKYRSNFRRCISYLNQGKDCAVVGNFKEYERFIDCNIRLVSEKIEKQIYQNETSTLSTDDILREILESSGDSDIESVI